MTTASWLNRLPIPVRRRFDDFGQAFELFAHAENPRVLAAIAPSGLRGFVLQSAKGKETTAVRARHDATFDWTYSRDSETIQRLSARAKASQWNADTDLPWDTSVDPEDPSRPLVAGDLVDFGELDKRGIVLNAKEKSSFRHSMLAWMLSQFLHGEQGALYAACQVVEAVPGLERKLFGATQVVDEARHIEAFDRYLSTKLQRRYPINDNLFVILDALLSDFRWDIKFLGMQLIVEGLALSAFGGLRKRAQEPLLKEMLRRVIEDEARHVQFGLVALRDTVTTQLSSREVIEREDWALEIVTLMRNRFYAFEVYEEWFEHRLTRQQWREVLDASPEMSEFRRQMFGRLTRNLRDVGLLGPRVAERYRRMGLQFSATAEPVERGQG